MLCRWVVLFRLSVPVQVIDWKDSSPKWPIMCWWGTLNPTNSTQLVGTLFVPLMALCLWCLVCTPLVSCLRDHGQPRNNQQFWPYDFRLTSLSPSRTFAMSHVPSPKWPILCRVQVSLLIGPNAVTSHVGVNSSKISTFKDFGLCCCSIHNVIVSQSEVFLIITIAQNVA